MQIEVFDGECTATDRYFDRNCIPDFYEAAKLLEFEVIPPNYSVGSIEVSSPTDFAYDIPQAGRYGVTVVRIERDLSWAGNNNGGCAKVSTQAEIQVAARKTLDGNSVNFDAEAQGINFSISKNLSCGRATYFVAGNSIDCTLSISSSPIAYGTVPYISSIFNGIFWTSVRKGVLQIGGATSVSFKVPVTKSAQTMHFKVSIGARETVTSNLVKPVPTKSTKPKVAPLAISISGPGQIVRGRVFGVQFRANKPVTTICMLTSLTVGPNWGDLGYVNLVRGYGFKKIKILWPAVLGDSPRTGIIIRCLRDGYGSSDFWYTQGFWN